MDDMPRPVLVADDQPDVIAALRLLLRSAGFDTQGASSVDEVRAQLAAREYDAVVMDLNYARDTTSGTEGLDLIADVHATWPDLPLIAMTGWANIETAVEAMRRGARGYVPKPWSNQALVQVLRDEIAHTRDARRARAGAAREWRDAQAVQRALLPSSLPEVAGCSLAVRWEPASGVGGDYYDVFALDDDRLALCAGDVCGKGLSAALLVSSLQATVRACAAPDDAPDETMARVNARAVPAGCPWPVRHPRARGARHARSHAAVLQRRPPRPDPRARRRHRERVSTPAGWPPASSTPPPTTASGSRSPPATGCCSSPTDSPRPGSAALREFGDDRLVDAVLRHRDGDRCCPGRAAVRRGARLGRATARGRRDRPGARSRRVRCGAGQRRPRTGQPAVSGRKPAWNWARKGPSPAAHVA